MTSRARNGHYPRPNKSELRAPKFERELLTIHEVSLDELPYNSRTYFDVMKFYRKQNYSVADFVKIVTMLFQKYTKIRTGLGTRHPAFLIE